MNTLTGPQIQRMIDDLRRVIASCEPLTAKAKVPQLDTDILRSQLQGIYEQLFFAPQAYEKLTAEKTSLLAAEPVAAVQKPAPVAEVVPQPVSAPVVQPVAAPVEAAPPIIAPAPAEKVTAEKTSLPAAEPVAVAQKPAPVAEVAPQPVAAPPVAVPVEAVAPIIPPAPAEKLTAEKTSLPVSEPVAVAPKPVPVAEPVAKPAPQPQPKAEPAKPAPASQFQSPAPTTRFQQKPITNISAAIGLNDRFLYIRTLFGGNATELADTVAKLNAMQSFDEAMQYIGSHYQWDMEDAVTVQFLELVNRRFI